MTKRLWLALTVQFVWCALCQGQSVTVNVVDQSTTACPVRLSGRIDLREWEEDGLSRTSYVDHIVVTNLSKVSIIALVTFSQIGNSYGPLVGQYNQLDAFFSHELEVAPGRAYTHEHQDSGDFSMPIAKEAIKATPAATSRVVFAQFGDGSTCGDRNDGRVVALMDTRADLLQGLKKLDAAATQGEREFLEALSSGPTDITKNAETILSNVRYRQKRNGSTNAIQYIRNMLAVAATR